MNVEKSSQAIKPLDDPRLQQLFGDAIEGALALGYQNSSPPPEGHWLWRFWNIGRAEAESEQPVALSTLTDELAISQILAAKEDSPAGKWLYDFAKAIERRAASAPAQQGEPQQPEPVAWLESEPSTTDWPVRNLFFGLSAVAYSSRMHFGEKPAKLLGSGNRLTALYATPPHTVAAEGVTESVAKAIYQQWKELLGFRPWEERGNSLMQDKARDLARAALSGTGSDESKKGEGNG